jgi:hypothetical protein
MRLFCSSFSGGRVISNLEIFSKNKSCETYSELILPPGGRNWQLIFPNFLLLKQKMGEGQRNMFQQKLFCLPMPIFSPFQYLQGKSR